MNSNDRENVIKLIKDNISHRAYFLKKTKDPEYFFTFKNLGSFSANSLPKSEDKDQFGNYYIPEWPALSYLKRLSEVISNDYSVNKSLAKEIIKIIKEIGPKERGNFITRRGVIDILVTLPVDLIDSEILDFVCNWIGEGSTNGALTIDVTDKLLGRLLSSNGNNLLAEKLFDVITNFNRPEREDEKISLYVDPYWLNIGIEKHRRDIGKKFSIDDYRELERKIEEILAHSLKENEYSYEIEDLKISLNVTGDKLKFKFIKESKSYSKDYNAECSRTVIIEDFFNSLQKNEVLKNEEKETFSILVTNVHTSLHAKSTYTSLAKKPYQDEKDPLVILTGIFIALLEEKVKNKDDSANSFFVELLSERFLLFPKIVLLLIGKYPDYLREIFWKSFESKNNDVILNELFFGEELRNALENIKDISNDERKLLENSIEAGPSSFIFDSNEGLIMWKQMRYKALSHDPHFKKKHDELFKITEYEMELSPAIETGKMGWVTYTSPISEEEMVRKGNSDLADFLKNYIPSSDFEGHSTQGVGESLENSVYNQPKHFSDNLEPFLESPYFWLSKMLRGFVRAVKENKNLDLGKIIIFLESLFSKKEFWSDSFQILKSRDFFETKHDWVLVDISDLVVELIQDEKSLLSEDEFSKFKALIETSLEKIENTKSKNDEDPISHAINTPVGRIFETYIRVLLYKSKKFLDSSNENLVSSDRECLIKLVERNHLEVWTLIGRYFSNINYLDTSLAKELVQKRAPNLELLVRRGFIIGFLSGSRFCNSSYEIMKKELAFCLERREELSLDRNSNNNLIRQFTIAYLRELEEIDSDYFDKFLNSIEVDGIEEVLSFFELLSRDLSTKEEPVFKHRFALRVLKLGKELYEKLSDIEDESESKSRAIASLVGVTRFIEDFDQKNICIVYKGVSKLTDRVQHAFFLEHLIYQMRKSEDTQLAGKIANIYLEWLNFCTPDYPTKEIVELISWFYEKGEKVKANKICDIYAKRGPEFLVDTFKLNNL